MQKRTRQVAHSDRYSFLALPRLGKRVCLAICSCLLLISSVAGASWSESSIVRALFEKDGLTGTFVLYDPLEKRFVGYNKKRAEQRFLPASTFKIPNTLIGLDSGAVKDVDEIFPYDGASRELKAWEKDMGLREAIVVSNVPVYQELARRITLQRMRKYVVKLHYGNENIGSTVDTFWLEGPLKISAIEQTVFLAKLAQNALPVSLSAQRAVEDITLLEKQGTWELHAKTGTAVKGKKRTGWWVGWVKQADKIYSFALNVDISVASGAAWQDPAAPENRIRLGKAALKALGHMGAQQE